MKITESDLISILEIARGICNIINSELFWSQNPHWSEIEGNTYGIALSRDSWDEHQESVNDHRADSQEKSNPFE